jgi:hypothetical protein
MDLLLLISLMEKRRAKLMKSVVVNTNIKKKLFFLYNYLVIQNKVVSLHRLRKKALLDR